MVAVNESFRCDRGTNVSGNERGMWSTCRWRERGAGRGWGGGGGGGGTARGYSWPAVDLLKVRAQELCERQGGPGFQSIIVLVITFQFLILKQRVVFGDLPLFYIIFYFIILAAGMILIPAEHPLILQHVTGQQKHKQILSHWWQFCLQASEDWYSSQ